MVATHTAIYQTQHIRTCERLAEEQFGLSGQILMQRAGQAALHFLQQHWPEAKRLILFCGSGGNGGDGYVLARLAQQQGYTITIYQVAPPHPAQQATCLALKACYQANIDIHLYHEGMTLPPADVIVDAICGIGVRETLRPPVMTAITAMHLAGTSILALDLPSGIDADTGKVLGMAVRATATITFIGLKLGLLTGSGTAHVGTLACHSLDLPLALFSAISPIAETIQMKTYMHYLKPRPRDWHKGRSGSVLIIGGELGFSGAPQMAARAALRVGAGLVTVATRPEQAPLLHAGCPEIMCRGVSTPKQLTSLLDQADVVVLGPGLGQSTWSQRLWTSAVKTHLPLVIDADGLRLLAKTRLQREQWVLTPHPGEAAGLLHENTSFVQADRFSALKAIHQRYGGTCVLKGAGSLIWTPSTLPVLCCQGNPGMASAGMGDVLSGVIGGLMAQGIPSSDATILGVCLHATAGDLAAKEGERGTIATDLLPYLRHLVNP